MCKVLMHQYPPLVISNSEKYFLALSNLYPLNFYYIPVYKILEILLPSLQYILSKLFVTDIWKKSVHHSWFPWILLMDISCYFHCVKIFYLSDVSLIISFLGIRDTFVEKEEKRMKTIKRFAKKQDISMLNVTFLFVPFICFKIYHTVVKFRLKTYFSIFFFYPFQVFLCCLS